MKENIWIFGLLLLIVAFFFDGEILKFMYIIRLDFLINFMKFISYFWVVVFILVMYIILLKDEKKIMLFGLIVVSTYILTILIKMMVMRERPENALVLEPDYSFPSSHAAVMFSTIALMNKEFPKLKWGFLGIALLVTFSRVYLGVHYTSDLIFGALLGYGVSRIFMYKNAIFNKIKVFLSVK